MNKKVLINIWNNVWEENMTKMEVQKIYFKKIKLKSSNKESFIC